MTYTVLEIGSGSFKLKKQSEFDLRFQSSLGKGLKDSKLDPLSVQIALNSLDQEIIPFLKERKIHLNEVLVFATAAIREAMKDPATSGEFFLQELLKRGFVDPRVFSEDEECDYAALAVGQDLRARKTLIASDEAIQSFILLDTGGASHQLIEVHDTNIFLKKSFPIGSHADFTKVTLPDFKSLGYSQRLPLVLIGTSGAILHGIKDFGIETLRKLCAQLPELSIIERRTLLVSLTDPAVHPLFVDFRLEILPNAFKLVLNCAENLQVTKFLSSKMQAIDYVCEFGFSHHEESVRTTS